MTARTFIKVNFFFSILGLALISPELSSGQSYTLQDIGSNAWSYSAAHGLNALGHVVGEYEPTNFFYVLAFLYADGTLTDIGHLPGTPYAIAYGISDTNVVVGESSTAISTHAFKWVGGTISDLGTLGAIGGYSSAHAVNRAGQIVGEASLANASVIHAILYSGTSKTDLGALGGDYSSANAINNSDVIVGESDIVEGSVTNVHAFIYTNGAMHDLGTLGGTYSSAKGINDSGVIVGESDTVIGGVTYTHAFIYRNGALSDLGTLGGNVSSASAINSAGQVVGYATDSSEVEFAFLYDGSKMVNLNDFIPPGSGWTNLASADAINDAGQIAGSGYLADGSYHAYLLSPAPPFTIAITNPAPNAVFPAPATFVVSASATDSAGTVTNVQFLVNNSIIGEVSTAPYSATASNLGAGVYRLTVVGADDTGLKATNSITVTVTDIPPTVLITNPAPNATFQAPATFTIGASASDSDGTVTNVQFLVNGSVIGDSTAVPYSATANNLSAGPYTLTAIASDDAGLKATNSIVVTVGDLPPTVAITNPAPNAAFQAPATFAVSASASDSDGTVTNVQFLVNGSVIGDATSVPYTATANNLSAGPYTLTAIASDNAGLNATNSIVITVTNASLPAITLSNLTFTGTNFSFSFATQVGYTYEGEFVTPLAATNNWVVFTNVAGNGSVAWFTDWNLTNGQRFYRVVAH